MQNKIITCILLCLLAIQPAIALVVERPLADPVQEARARVLFHEIRCVVCQSEAIADSPAQVAADIRKLIREKIAAGESNAAIKSYLVGQYGDGILMKPPLQTDTLALWFGPFIILLLGGVFAWRYFRSGVKT